jgi:hypothetical protein
MDGSGVAILSVLDEEYHEKCDNRCPGVDEQLPCIPANAASYENAAMGRFYSSNPFKRHTAPIRSVDQRAQLT